MDPGPGGASHSTVDWALRWCEKLEEAEPGRFEFVRLPGLSGELKPFSEALIERLLVDGPKTLGGPGAAALAALAFPNQKLESQLLEEVQKSLESGLHPRATQAVSLLSSGELSSTTQTTLRSLLEEKLYGPSEGSPYRPLLARLRKEVRRETLGRLGEQGIETEEFVELSRRAIRLELEDRSGYELSRRLAPTLEEIEKSLGSPEPFFRRVTQDLGPGWPQRLEQLEPEQLTNLYLARAAASRFPELRPRYDAVVEPLLRLPRAAYHLGKPLFEELHRELFQSCLSALEGSEPDRRHQLARKALELGIDPFDYHQDSARETMLESWKDAARTPIERQLLAQQQDPEKALEAASVLFEPNAPSSRWHENFGYHQRIVEAFGGLEHHDEILEVFKGLRRRLDSGESAERALISELSRFLAFEDETPQVVLEIDDQVIDIGSHLLHIEQD